jgi:anti-anti-sigma regulatory factor
VLDVEIRRSPNGGTTCRLDGELLASEAHVLRALHPVVGHGSSLLVDLRDVQSFDRVGLGALIGLLRLARRTTHRVELTGASPELRLELQREGIDRLYPLVPEVPKRPARIERRRPRSRVHGSARS